ncbi:hypothetical protein [Flammeovirga sp. SJP92]|uniref:hypothetical protein n=1 Tax=Flammeovirga sp. SJP92 TaxID=1775430 RepID=UPI0007887663|nr:hypothetical protein [Flammeovirga sp. SJP92]KXX66797.1 hypothetical protein AVL50_30150 [Flammeovirga sp. SJP92]
MQTHEIVSDGQKFIFNVIKNFTEPCPECGVPACGKEDILWYEDKNRRIAIIFDGGYFDLAGEEFFDKNIKTMEYDTLPIFMKQWNEARGWSSCWDYNGYTLFIDDFLEAMELLKSCEMGKWITMEEVLSMEDLANNAKSIGAKLKIGRG